MGVVDFRGGLAVLGLAIGLGLGGSAVAQTRPVVVELFTSQGCSSCPPADALLAELGSSDDVIALAYHVDYWDYLGWQDTFGDPAFTQRQRAYAHKVDRQYIGRHLRGSFTPEVVVQGTDSLVGSSKAKIAARIKAHAAQPQTAILSLRREEGALRVALTPESAGGAGGIVMLAEYTPKSRVEVKRGENAGQMLTYTHIVTGLRELAQWDGRAAIEIRVGDVPGPAAVFVQRGKGGPILTAAKID